ncbi:MAG: YihY family inner membrane protein [Betaproteobacteria bacterium]|nr:YihY family inner membrane protein [Betaproteobacteria bacterium]
MGLPSADLNPMTGALANRPSVLDATAFLRLLSLRAREARVAQTASSLAFLSLLAVVPMVAIAFAVLTILPAFGDLRGSLQAFFASQLFPPAFSETVVQYVNQFASKADKLSVVGIFILFLTALSALRTIERTLDGIWGVADRRPWAHRLALYWTIMTLGPLLAGGSVAIHSYFWTVTRSLGQKGVIAASAWTDIVPWLMTTVAVSLLYRLLPNTLVRWRDALIAGALAGLALEFLKGAFGWYVRQVDSFTVVYGTFAALPAFLVWLYTLWLVVLGGALLAANLPHWGAASEARAAEAPGTRFELALEVLMALVGQARSAAPPRAVSALKPLFRSDATAALQLSELLERAGYLRRLSSTLSTTGVVIWDEVWVLAKDPAQLTLRPLFELLWLGDRVGSLTSGRTDLVAGIGADGRSVGLPRLDVSLAAMASSRARTDPH